MAQLPIGELLLQLSPSVHGRPTERPEHLALLVDELEIDISGRGPGQRFFWSSVPPRHWKTSTLEHAIVKHLLCWPESSVAFCTHTQSFANNKSREIRRLAKAAGLAFADDSNRQDEWELSTGGGLTARGVGGELTGRGFRLIVVDDPIKGRQVADSPVERERVFRWIEDDVITRLTPDGAIVLNHTRWHPDDPIGRYRTRGDWPGCNLQALTGSEGEEVALLPSQWPVETLRRIRDVNPYRFASLYQGEPRPRGDAVFGPAHWYQPSEIPKLGYTCAHGVDLAYSAKTYADRSVCWTMLRWRTPDDRELFFVVDCRIRRCKAPEFVGELQQARRDWPGQMLWYASGTEAGSADFIIQSGVPLTVQRPAADKFGRAQPLAAAWNDGRVLLPARAEDSDAPPDWAEEIVQEFASFTGVHDKHDDLVDAGAAAYDLLASTTDTRAPALTHGKSLDDIQLGTSEGYAAGVLTWGSAVAQRTKSTPGRFPII